MTEPVLAIAGVTRHFRRGGERIRALDGVSLALVPGEVAALVGPTGAGKTTLLRVAAGVLVPDAGLVRVAGRRPGGLETRRLVGFAPETPVFPPALTVREVLEYYARFHAGGVRPRALVREAIELAALEHVAHRRVAGLSATLARCLALGQAVLGRRRLLLLDETLGGLDAATRGALAERLARRAQQGVTVLLATRDLAAAERFAGRVYVLHRGAVVRETAVAALSRERVLEIVLDRPPPEPPPGFRATATGLETDLGAGTVEGALAVCRAHRLVVRASRVRVKCLEDVLRDVPR